MSNINKILTTFDPISLEEMDSVKLLNRTDTKFVFSEQQVPQIFESIRDHYQILEIKGVRSNAYRTLYFDTPNFDYYTLHQNGKKNRYKVRFRKYVDSGLCFLEIKFKNNKSRTVKSRIRVPDIETEMSADSMAFVESVMQHQPVLEAKLWNSFERVTLVNNEAKERLTIDFNLRFDFNGKEAKLENTIIAEVKQEKASRNSNFVGTIKDLRIRPTRISKYCVGALMLNAELKHNNFKEKILFLNKIKHGLV